MSDQVVPTPSARQGTAAEGVEQKALMQDEGKQPQTDPVRERALSHPKRLAMLGYLMEKRGTGTEEEELVEVLDLPAPRVKYHLTVLQSADLIAHVDDLEQGTASRYIAAASAGL
ncbi:MAG: winged helix-turn-helix domain-containing protein [Solirubrobacterales bacterium]